MADLTCTSSTSFAPHRAPRTRLMQYLALWQQRRALAKMAPHQLKDIGVTRAQAYEEAARPIWDVPAHWQQ